MKIVSDDKIPFLDGVFEPYITDVCRKKGALINNDDLRDADALIVRTRTECNAALLENTAVKVVATATIGTDHVNTGDLNKLGIQFFSAPGCNAMSVQQYVVCALLHIAGKYNIELAGKTVGIVGVGNVGGCVEKACRTMGMRVLLNDPPRAAKEGGSIFCELDYLLKEADFVTLHVPLDEGTYHLADEVFFTKMKNSAFFINSSRGSVCDNKSLKKALVQKQIAGAILDVWENEPDIDRELQAMLELGTMHIAGYSADGKANGTSVSVRNIAKTLGIKELYDFEVSGLVPGNSEALQIKTASNQQVLSVAALSSYDIKKDSDALLKNPADFEKLRGDYHYRREFCGWTIAAGDMSEENIRFLKEMNFKIEE